MVSRFVSFMQKEVGGLHEAAYLLGASAIASQLLALVRDRLLAHTFGAGSALDLYYSSFRIPDLIFATIASLVSASVLIPFLSGKFSKSHEEGKKFFDAVFTVFSMAIIASAALAFIIAPKILPMFLPGFNDPSSLATLTTLTRILLLSPIFLGFSNLFASITQLKSRFFIYAISPLVYNLGIILGVLIFVPRFGLPGLAFGVVLGAFAHMAVQIPFIVSQGLFPVFARIRELSTAQAAIIASLPRTLAVSANEIAKFFLISLASILGTGSIAVFNFSWNLQSVPLAVIGVSYSLAAFPTLSKFMAEGNIRKYLEHVVTTARHIIFLCLPIAALFIVLRAQIVRVILGSGQFSWDDTRLTAAALAIFVLSLVSQSLVLLFTRARYSTGNTHVPLLINVFSSGVIVALSYILVNYYESAPRFTDFITVLFRVSDLPGTSVLMLSLAFTLGMTLAAIAHMVSFHRAFLSQYKNNERPHMELLIRTFFDSLLASLVMGAIAYGSLNILDDIFGITTFIGIFAQGFVSGIIGITAGIVALKFVKNREIEEIWSTLHRKFWKVPVVGPDAEEGI